MNWVEVPAPKRKAHWKGKKVRLATDRITAQAAVPAGAIGRIERKVPGASYIIIDACKCCGISPVIYAADDSAAFVFVEARQS